MPIPKSDASGEATGFWRAEDVVQRASGNSSSVGEEFSRRDDERLTSLARFTQLEYVALDSTQTLLDHAMRADYAEQRLTLTDLRWIPASVALLLLILKFLPGLQGSACLASTPKEAGARVTMTQFASGQLVPLHDAKSVMMNK